MYVARGLHYGTWLNVSDRTSHLSNWSYLPLCPLNRPSDSDGKAEKWLLLLPKTVHCWYEENLCQLQNLQWEEYRLPSMCCDTGEVLYHQDEGCWALDRTELTSISYLRLFVAFKTIPCFDILVWAWGSLHDILITFQETNEQYLIICLQTAMAFISTHTVRKWTLNFLIGYLHVAIDLFCSLICTLSVGCTCIIGVRIDVKTVTKSIVW